jgi:Flp pilus assembly protein TadG
MRWTRSDRGVATVWTVVVFGACVLMGGLVLDGGTILRARSSTFDLASGAARAAAQQFDQPPLSRGSVVLDPGPARDAAIAWLAARGASGTVVVEGDTATVTVRRDVRLQVLRPASVVVTETASAQAQRGSPP